MIGNRPVLWHIMKTFSTYGHNEFVLALGEGGEDIRNYFLEYRLRSGDIEVNIADSSVEMLNNLAGEDWKIKMIDTGIGAHTGSRIARCRRYLSDSRFLVTYADCLCSVNLDQLIEFHKKQAKTVTVTGVQPTSRFGTFYCEGEKVTGYSLNTKMTGINGYVNGGFMVLEPTIFNHVEVFNESNLEREVFEQLATKSQVAVFPHTGYWQAVDTERDLIFLNHLYNQNQRPWLPDSESFQTKK